MFKILSNCEACGPESATDSCIPILAKVNRRLVYGEEYLFVAPAVVSHLGHDGLRFALKSKQSFVFVHSKLGEAEAGRQETNRQESRNYLRMHLRAYLLLCCDALMSVMEELISRPTIIKN
eukprot:scaffold7407_cov120-Skeletonema_dohrnii-CCMP3373.AAC.3